MKKLFLLLFELGTGLSMQAQEDTWAQRAESFEQLYSLATDIGKETEKVTAQGSVVSVIKPNGTISLQQAFDKSKPNAKEIKAYKYSLLTSAGKTIPLDLKNSERVIESFYSKLLQLKEKMRENYDQDVEQILGDLFN